MVSSAVMNVFGGLEFGHAPSIDYDVDGIGEYPEGMKSEPRQFESH